MKGLDKEIKELIDLGKLLEDIIIEITNYITKNYENLRREVFKELKEEYNME